jgi:glycolate oxidase FAD binding subunit
MTAALAPLLDRIRDAARDRTPLRIVGGGTKDFYGESLRGEELSTAALSGITSYEPSELVVCVLAGTRLAELEQALAAQRQCLAFEPPHFGPSATVGGMVAAGLSGPARANAGSVRDHVLGVTMVNGRGELLTFGGTVMKNVAGYDLSRLMAGAMGALGLLVEINLKVLPLPAAEATLRFDMPQADALRRVNEWSGKPLPLSASCWVEDAGRGTLFLRLRGAVAAVEAACRSLGGERLPDDEEATRDWIACREQRLPWFGERGDRDLWRVSVPQTAPALDLPDTPLVEWHGGQRWIRASAAEGQTVRDAAVKAGGHATLFRRGGSARSLPCFTPLSGAQLRIQRNVKNEFDPAGIFNAGRMFPDM